MVDCGQITNTRAMHVRSRVQTDDDVPIARCAKQINVRERTDEAVGYLKKRRKVPNRPVYGYDRWRGKLYVTGEEQAVIAFVTAVVAADVPF
jgi:hypothetical protein